MKRESVVKPLPGAALGFRAKPKSFAFKATVIVLRLILCKPRPEVGRTLVMGRSVAAPMGTRSGADRPPGWWDAYNPRSVEAQSQGWRRAGLRGGGFRFRHLE